jgi:hypothetical protein
MIDTLKNFLKCLNHQFCQNCPHYQICGGSQNVLSEILESVRNFRIVEVAKIVNIAKGVKINKIVKICQNRQNH